MAVKRAIFWTGYKVHFTQTCDEDAPQLITHVETTAAPLSDEGVIGAIHVDLSEKGEIVWRTVVEFAKE